MSYGLRLHVWGERACFTRPEMKAERVSYDVITPSAARGILEAIHWKPAIRWTVDRIHVLNPIRFASIRRNEVGSKLSTRDVEAGMAGRGRPELVVEDDRQQRVSLFLEDVAYVIEAHFTLTERAGPTDTAAKHAEIMTRRVRKGQCFQQPVLGCREFPANFTLIEGDAPRCHSSLEGDRDLGWMLHDIDFGHGRTPRFFRARMIDGVIVVPPFPFAAAAE